MSKNKQGIQNLEELQKEIQRLKIVAADQKQTLREDFREVKENLRMENIISNAVSSITGININKKEFLKNGIAMGLSLVLQRFVFKTETTIERKVYSWIDTFFDKVKLYMNKFSSTGAVGSEKIEEQD